MKIHYTGQCGEGWGWGCMGTNMVRCWREMGVWAENWMDADCIFHPIADHDFNTPFPQTPRAKVNFAMTFFESALGPNAAANAAKYDVLFVGSTWCKERCAERGIYNTEVLIQGVDRSIFKPLTNPYRELNTSDKLRIFSGGKFEFRKGQDLVIAAFREFAKVHPEAHLVCAWHNPWPRLITAELDRMSINTKVFATSQEDFFTQLLAANDIPYRQFTILPQLTHLELAREMANTDCGLFPNRCEGGTNLVLMEYAACGGIVVANWRTGHYDVKSLIDHPISSKEDEKRWAVQDSSKISRALEHVHTPWCSRPKEIPTWESAAKQVITRAEELLASHSHK